MKEEKRAVRARTLLQRESLSASEVSLWSRLIQAGALQFAPYIASRLVALYSPIGNEVATEEIRDHALRTGKKLFYPKLEREDSLNLVQVRSAEELRPGRYGILEPAGGQAMMEQDQDGLVVFVPGVAFDMRGNRLGRGKGWYDRVLTRLRGGVERVGLAYEFQVVGELPAEGSDQRVHHIITEKRIIDCCGITSRSGVVS